MSLYNSMFLLHADSVFKATNPKPVEYIALFITKQQVLDQYWGLADTLIYIGIKTGEGEVKTSHTD